MFIALYYFPGIARAKIEIVDSLRFCLCPRFELGSNSSLVVHRTQTRTLWSDVGTTYHEDYLWIMSTLYHWYCTSQDILSTTRNKCIDMPALAHKCWHTHLQCLHARASAHTHTQTHTHTHTNTHTYTHKHAYTRTHARKQARTYVHTRTHACTRGRTHTQTHTLARTHARAHRHTRTHAHKHACTQSSV